MLAKLQGTAEEDLIVCFYLKMIHLPFSSMIFTLSSKR